MNNSNDRVCAFNASTLRATFGEENQLTDQDWVGLIFKKIIEVITIQSARGGKIKLAMQGESFECEMPSASLSSKSNFCRVLQQNFKGAILMLKTEPSAKSFILFFGGFPEVNCVALNGEVSKIFPEASIKTCDSSALWC
jgi:hypothetical protein